MYFGLNPFNMQFNRAFQPRPPFQNVPPPRQGINNPNPPQNNGGFFNGFNNFIQNNFMNPLFQGNHNNEQQRPDEPLPTFFRKTNKKANQDQRPFQGKKDEKPSENTGLYWKMKGNQAYQKGNYEEAITCYSKAIEINSTESVFYSNRAQCLKKLAKTEEALKDAQEALELDSNNVRGHLVAGQCLAQIGKQEDSIKKVENAVVRFTRALTLSGGKRIELEKEISRYIYLAKKLLFYLKFALIRNARIDAVSEYKEYLDKDPLLDMEVKKAKMQAFLEASNEKIVFSIPDYLQCRITLQLMEDPVMTDCGQTYERQALEHHIERNGKTDPFTRQPIKGPLYPNIAIRKAVQEFLERNPWAYQFCEGENYKTISF